MMLPEIRNARIKDTRLGFHDGKDSWLTIVLELEYDCAGQGFVVILDHYDRDGGVWVSKLQFEVIRKILETVDVDSWEQLKGKYIRCLQEHTKVHAIGHIIKDVWFNPSEYFAKQKEPQ